MSSTATYLSTSTWPVSVSTSTAQMCAPNGNTRFSGSKNADPSSPGSTPCGRLCARHAENAISGIVLATSGAPRRRNAPSDHSTSFSGTSNSCAAIFRPFSRTRAAACAIAGVPTAAPRLPYVSHPFGEMSVSPKRTSTSSTLIPSSSAATCA